MFSNMPRNTCSTSLLAGPILLLHVRIRVSCLFPDDASLKGFIWEVCTTACDCLWVCLGLWGLCACVCACMRVRWGGVRKDGREGVYWVSADVIIRPWNSENSWVGWTVLEGFLSAPRTKPPPLPSARTPHASPPSPLALRKNSACSNTQQSITPNCRTHIVNNKYSRTSCNCNLMAVEFTSICDMRVWSEPLIHELAN